MNRNTDYFFVGEYATFLATHPLLSTAWPFTLLSINSSYIFYIKKSIKSEQILELLDLLPEANNVTIVLKAGTQAIIRDNRTVVNNNLSIYLQEGARLLYSREDVISSNNVMVNSTITITAAAFSHCAVYAFLKATRYHTLSIHLVPHGAQAEIRLRGVYLQKADQELIITTHQNHDVAQGTTEVICKGIVSGAARVQYEGLIHIAKNAANSVARQQNKSLVLSPNARVVSKPRLEVLNKEVVCSHGAAVGSYDKEALLYLQSRGLSLPEAQQLLLEGFLQSIMEDEPISYVNSLITQQVAHFIKEL